VEDFERSGMAIFPLVSVADDQSDGKPPTVIEVVPTWSHHCRPYNIYVPKGFDISFMTLLEAIMMLVYYE